MLISSSEGTSYGLIPVQCPYCQSDQIVKRSKTDRGKQRYRCHNSDCPHQSFVLNPTYKGQPPEIKEQMIDMALNGNGIHDTARVIKISTNTVINKLKKDQWATFLDGSKRSLIHWILVTFLLCPSCFSRRLAKELEAHVRTSYRWCWWLRNTALSDEIGRKLTGTVEAADLTTPTDTRDRPRQTGRNHGDANCGGAVRSPGPPVLRNCHQLTAFEQAEMILYAALEPVVASRSKKGEIVTCLDPFKLL